MPDLIDDLAPHVMLGSLAGGLLAYFIFLALLIFANVRRP